MSRNNPNNGDQFSRMTYSELLEIYQGTFNLPKSIGYSGSRSDAQWMSDLQAEIRRRERIGDVHGKAVLKLGDAAPVELRVK